MNRQQRRHADKEQIGMVDLRHVTYPWQMTDEECFTMFRMRTESNVQEAKHPYHHKTASGVIVEPDPTLEYYAKRLKANPKYRKMIEEYEQRHIPLFEEGTRDIPKAVPVNRKFYGHDPFERH